MVDRNKSKSTSRAASRKAPPGLRVYPHLDYAIDTQLRHLRPGNGIPILVEFSAKQLERFDKLKPSLKAFIGKRWLGDGVKAAVDIPAIFDAIPNPPAAEFFFCVVLVERKMLTKVRSDPGWNKVIVSAEIGPPVNWQKGKPAARSSAKTALASIPQPASNRAQAVGGLGAVAPVPSRVVIAVLDEGIAFAHPRFQTATGSRIAYFWNQDGKAGPAPFNSFGSEITAANINSELAKALSTGLADESSVYQTIGELDFALDRFKAIAQRRSHGTHVLDLAAAMDGSPFLPDSRPIIAVEMPERAIADSSGATLTPFMLLGILYILWRADMMATQQGEPLPVVVNLSYGMYAGPHNGSHAFERVVDLLVKAFDKNSRTPLHVVIAAGNHRLARAHAMLRLAPGKMKTLHWRIQPDDRTPSLLQIWLAQSTDKVQVTVRPPAPNVLPVMVTEGKSAARSGPLGLIFGGYYVAGSGAVKPYIDVVVEPTAPAETLSANEPTAPAGLWKIEIKNTSTARVNLNAYIQRDDTIYGRKPMGRQSYFDDPKSPRYDLQGRPLEFDPVPKRGYVSRTGTLNALATGTETYVIGGYRRNDRMPARYSSMGPLRPGALRVSGAPNWLAPSDDSSICYGVLAAGTRGGCKVIMNGTSVAAPQSARWIADQIASGKPIGVRPPPEFEQPPIPPPTRPPLSGGGLLIVPGRNESGSGPLLLPGRNARP